MKRIFIFLVIALVATVPIWWGAWVTEMPQVQITKIKTGTGKEAVFGARVRVHYTGWTLDGQKFDSSRDRNSPIEFYLGAGSVIDGWDIGVAGMRVGGKRELIIPPELGYGQSGYPPKIPPDATLKFEVELVDVLGLSYTNIDNDDLKDLLVRGVPIVDLRDQEEWDQTGVIEGSNLITAFDARRRLLPTFVVAFEKLVGPQDEVILICHSGPRSLALSRHLGDNEGYSKIYNVENGIMKWIEDGGAVVKP